MAAIDDLISQIQDAELRDRIQKEVNKLSKQKKFGLVFEEHMPECTPLYDMPIKRGCKVMLRDNKEDKSIYVVMKIEGDNAICTKRDNQEEISTFLISDIVRVAEFGESIYPYLKPLESFTIPFSNTVPYVLASYLVSFHTVVVLVIFPPVSTTILLPSSWNPLTAQRPLSIFSLKFSLRYCIVYG